MQCGGGECRHPLRDGKTGRGFGGNFEPHGTIKGLTSPSVAIIIYLLSCGNMNH